VFVLRGGGRWRGPLGPRCVEAVEAADLEHVLKGGGALVEPRQAGLEGRLAGGGGDRLAGAGLHQQAQQLVAPETEKNEDKAWTKYLKRHQTLNVGFF
jgi:hypothetical protein